MIAEWLLVVGGMFGFMGAPGVTSSGPPPGSSYIVTQGGANLVTQGGAKFITG
jgi:hypothetical protein